MVFRFHGNAEHNGYKYYFGYVVTMRDRRCTSGMDRLVRKSMSQTKTYPRIFCVLGLMSFSAFGSALSIDSGTTSKFVIK
jgi:hypothetical protein